jgi:hypothetical protein
MIVLTLFFTFFTIQALINWFFGLLDILFFSSYKGTEISNPVFITGVPRSGTTFMHRSLARDKGTFTSFTLGEILLAPTLIQKYFFFTVFNVDARIKSPLKRTIQWLEGKLTAKYDRIHPYSLFEPDEDEILMTGIFSSLYLQFLFPEMPQIMRYTRFDEDLTASEKKRIMEYYRIQIRKHLYFELRFKKRSCIYLAKSPALVAKMDSLYKTFPGCRIIYLERNPLATLPSWISMNATVFKIFHSPRSRYPLADGTVEMLWNWLQRAKEKLERKDQKSYRMVRYNSLIGNPGLIIRDIYAHFNLGFTGEYEKIINQISTCQVNYISPHHYSLLSMGLNKDLIEKKFSAFIMSSDEESNN